MIALPASPAGWLEGACLGDADNQMRLACRQSDPSWLSAAFSRAGSTAMTYAERYREMLPLARQRRATAMLHVAQRKTKDGKRKMEARDTENEEASSPASRRSSRARLRRCFACPLWRSHVDCRRARRRRARLYLLCLLDFGRSTFAEASSLPVSWLTVPRWFGSLTDS